MHSAEPNIPMKDKKSILDKKIRDLSKLGYAYEEISRLLNVSKTTVFYAIKGRKKPSRKTSH